MPPSIIVLAIWFCMNLCTFSWSWPLVPLCEHHPSDFMLLRLLVLFAFSALRTLSHPKWITGLPAIDIDLFTILHRALSGSSTLQDCDQQCCQWSICSRDPCSWLEYFTALHCCIFGSNLFSWVGRSASLACKVWQAAACSRFCQPCTFEVRLLWMCRTSSRSPHCAFIV